jgi:hypothetical protein
MQQHPGFKTTLASQSSTGAALSTHDSKSRFIFLVSKLPRLELDEIPSRWLSTKDFAHELLATYRARKGWWRYWFSVYDFSHCDFAAVRVLPGRLDSNAMLIISIQFERYRRNGYAYRGYGLPDAKNSEYWYMETSSRPPISEEEFKDLYQYAYRQSKPGWTALELPFNIDDGLPSDSVHRIPQRFLNFNKKLHTREWFWGILVRERRSAAMTALYIIVMMSPSLAFCVLYLLGIVEGDVQNATTPLVVSMTALGLFLASMIKERDKNEDQHR